MGADRADYIILGVRVSYTSSEADSHEKFKDFYENSHDENPRDLPISIVEDGMSGKYTFIGRVLLKALYGKDLGIFDLGSIDNNFRKLIQDIIYDKFPEYKGTPISVYVFTHWH